MAFFTIQVLPHLVNFVENLDEFDLKFGAKSSLKFDIKFAYKFLARIVAKFCIKVASI